VYEDEVDIHLNRRLDRTGCEEHAKTVMTPARIRSGTWRGVERKDGQLSWMEGERKTSSLFCFSYALADRSTDGQTHLRDPGNYRIHSSRQVNSRWPNGRPDPTVFLRPTARRQPHRASMEDLHANVTRNHRCRTMGQLMSESDDT